MAQAWMELYALSPRVGQQFYDALKKVEATKSEDFLRSTPETIQVTQGIARAYDELIRVLDRARATVIKAKEVQRHGQRPPSIPFT